MSAQTLRFHVSSDVWMRTYSSSTNIDNFPQLQQAFETGYNSSICQDPSSYDFWYGTQDHQKFEDFTCGRLCNAYELKEDCINRHQLVKFMGDKQVDFITYVHISHLHIRK
jgi:hypothetical protein